MKTYKLSLDGEYATYTNGDRHETVSVGSEEYQTWLAEGNTPEPAETTAEKKARLLAELKATRDQRLVESDAWVLPDFPGGASPAVLDYRQALRDMPKSHGSIAKLSEPSWPIKPTF